MFTSMGNSIREFILRWLSTLWGLFLLALTMLSVVVLLSADSTAAGLPRAALALLFATVFAFMLADFSIFHINRRFGPQKRVYYPNLKVWGAGILAGMGGAVLYFISMSTAGLIARGTKGHMGQQAETGQAPLIFLAIFNSPTEGMRGTQLEIVLFLTLALLLILIIWAIVKVCTQE